RRRGRRRRRRRGRRRRRRGCCLRRRRSGSGYWRRWSGRRARVGRGLRGWLGRSGNDSRRGRRRCDGRRNRDGRDRRHRCSLDERRRSQELLHRVGRHLGRVGCHLGRGGIDQESRRWVDSGHWRHHRLGCRRNGPADRGSGADDHHGQGQSTGQTRADESNRSPMDNGLLEGPPSLFARFHGGNTTLCDIEVGSLTESLQFCDDPRSANPDVRCEWHFHVRPNLDPRLFRQPAVGQY
ncbi:MAG: hypothetical protein E4H05_08680, partial [Acidimicrobiales bacterium]